jgi:DNA mismatch endonuclease (patch repair protein)
LIRPAMSIYSGRVLHYLLTDVLTKAQRSYNMSMIRARNTKPEILVRSHLRLAGLKAYRVHSDLQGKPDIIFPASRLAVFIDGCFWHKCPLDYHAPSTRKRFWALKISRNLARDREVNEALTNDGWKVLRVWEHQVRRSPESVVRLISENLQAGRLRPSGSHT